MIGGRGRHAEVVAIATPRKAGKLGAVLEGLAPAASHDDGRNPPPPFIVATVFFVIPRHASGGLLQII